MDLEAEVTPSFMRVGRHLRSVRKFFRRGSLCHAINHPRKYHCYTRTGVSNNTGTNSSSTFLATQCPITLTARRHKLPKPEQPRPMADLCQVKSPQESANSPERIPTDNGGPPYFLEQREHPLDTGPFVLLITFDSVERLGIAIRPALTPVKTHDEACRLS